MNSRPASIEEAHVVYQMARVVPVPQTVEGREDKGKLSEYLTGQFWVGFLFVSPKGFLFKISLIRRGTEEAISWRHEVFQDSINYS